jgi:outer membrane protein assembly factor BamB
MRLRGELMGGDPQSYIACLDIRADRQGRYPLRWRASAGGRGAVVTAFEGSPIVQDGRVYAALVSFAGVRSVTSIACYSTETGARLWQKEVCEAPDLKEDEPRFRPYLLTAAGPNIAYCSQTGAIIALDSLTGRRAWAVRYPGRGLKTTDGFPTPRDLAPCMTVEDRLFVAPADYDHVMALDIVSGKLLWESPEMEVVNLLGVAGYRLIATTGSQPRGIRGLDVATGVPDRHWLQPDDGTSELPTYGRGFLAGGKVYWPTFYGMRVLQQDDGQPDMALSYYLKNRLGDAVGNLAFGQGCLAIADAENLRVFVPAARRLEQFQRETLLHPADSAGVFRLAIAEADAGRVPDALSHFAEAERLARPGDIWEDQPLTTLARSHRWRLLVKAAQKRAQKGDSKSADELFVQAGEQCFSCEQRLHALAERAIAAEQAGQPESAVASWQLILTEADLRQDFLGDKYNNPQLAWAVATEKIASLLQAQGNRSTPATREPVGEFAARQLKKPIYHEPDKPLTRAFRPLAHAWQIHLVRGERLMRLSGDMPPTGSEAVIFSFANRDLICREAASGKARWRRELSSEPNWLGITDGCAVAAGALGIECLSLADGLLRWRFVAPVVPGFCDAQDSAVQDGNSDDNPKASAFQLAWPYVYYLQAGQRIWCLDQTDGKVVWSRWAPGAAILAPEPAGRFQASFLVGSGRLVANSLNGTRLILDAQTGQERGILAHRGGRWSRRPISLPDNRLLMVSGSDRESLLDLASTTEIWTRNTSAPSMSMTPPQFLTGASGLYQLLDGVRLQKVDPLTGAVERECLVATAPVQLQNAAWDQTAFYFVQKDILKAKALASGHILWTLTLPQKQSWQVMEASGTLVVYPLLDPAIRPWLLALGAAPGGGFLFAARLGLLQSSKQFPLLLVNPKNGMLVQCFHFQAVNCQPQVDLLTDGIAVGLGDTLVKLAWLD